MFSKSTIKYIQSLQHKKFRDEYGTFVAEGPKVVAELLDGVFFECEHIFCTGDWFEQMPGSLRNRYAGQIEVIRDFELEKVSSLSQPNHVLAVFRQKDLVAEPVVDNTFTLVLDDIRDPGNFGTIIRTADWFGVENIICSPHTADMYNPKVVQSTMASLGRVQVFYRDLEEWLNGKTLRKFAATLDGADVAAVGKISAGILIIGNESKGISKAIIGLADQQVTIPRLGGAESLNAAVATGILLHSLVT